MPPIQNFSDIKAGSWVDRYVPVRARPYARLARLDRPIGTWLLLIPCWWGVALAGRTSDDFPRGLWFALLFAIGAIVMRGAGCTINDIYDRKLDAQVERTRTRPLASGEIKLWQAGVFLVLLLLVGLGVLLLFNRLTVIIGAASLALIFSYPLMKRITWWPQLFLGLTFNWGALLGWTAMRDHIDLPAILLYIGGIFWTLAYDTIYAHQDKRDDALIGIKSTALLLGGNSMWWVAVFYALAIFFVGLGGIITGLGGYGFYTLMIAATAFAAFELTQWRMDRQESCLLRFRRNREFGFIILAGILVGHYL